MSNTQLMEVSIKQEDCAQLIRMRPLAYGYMRTAETEDRFVEIMKQEIKDAAESTGHHLAQIFYEDSYTSSAFDEMIVEVNRTKACHVIVTSMQQFSKTPLLLMSTLQCLEMTTAEVLEVSEVL